METAYTLRLFDAANRHDFDALFGALAPNTDTAVQARRRWWCFDNPRGGVFALFHDGEQIAATCYLGGKMLFEDNPGTGFEIGETATDPRHQRKGLFSKLVRACVAHAATSGSPIVYGTPNRQSTPGYAKLGFEIVETPRSWLFLMPRLPYAVTRLLRLRVAASARAPRAAECEITPTDYVETTQSYPRLNVADRAYMVWRLVETPMNYRFARIRTPAGTFECAMKVGRLGDHEVVVIAEYFLDGVKPPLRRVASLLRRAVADLASAPNAAGIYVHGERPTGVGLALLYAARVIPHRILPICISGAGTGHDDRKWFSRFQLSDCDIG